MTKDGQNKSTNQHTKKWYDKRLKHMSPPKGEPMVLQVGSLIPCHAHEKVIFGIMHV